MSRSRKTTAKDLRVPVDTVPGHRTPAHDDAEPTQTDGPGVRAELAGADVGADSEELALPLLAADGELLDGEGFDGDELEDERTIDRGSRPPSPSSSRRISPTLMKIFQRRREQIGLSLEQLARLSGVALDEVRRFEETQGQHRLVYDHAVVIARILGLRPSDLPGLRGKEGPADVRAMLGQLERAILAGPVLTFEGKQGERFGGALERVATAPAFAVKLGDDTLGEGWPKGALLGFVGDLQPRPGEVVLVRNRRGKQLALRRLRPPSYVGIAGWQPTYAASTGSDWMPVARLHVILPRG